MSEACSENLLHEASGGLVWLTINRPERLNVLDERTVAGLADAFERMAPLQSAFYPTVSADEVVQIAITSGTTGEPNGVMHTHNTLHWTGQGVIDHPALGLDMATWRSRRSGTRTVFSGGR